jgi:hypothetical protein
MGKKIRQNVVRVSDELYDLGRKMMSSRSAAGFSEYVRGLILLDAAQQSPNLLVGHDLPGWVTRDKRFEKYVLTRDDNSRERTL